MDVKNETRRHEDLRRRRCRDYVRIVKGGHWQLARGRRTIELLLGDYGRVLHEVPKETFYLYFSLCIRCSWSRDEIRP
jgi:hypothetical protein